MFNRLCYSLLRDSTAAARVAGAPATMQPTAVDSMQRSWLLPESLVSFCHHQGALLLNFFGTG